MSLVTGILQRCCDRASLNPMAKIKTKCPNCGHSFEIYKRFRGRQISCPDCKHLVSLPRNARKKLFVCLLITVVLVIAVMAWLVSPMGVHWPDRRPIGVLFLASNYHSSATNPRGWFNDPGLNFVGPGGQDRFRKALLDYADTSITNLQRVGAQGVIVWDLEGEEFPHKTSFIGDPRSLDLLAPEMAPIADEFFKRLRNAGLKVGVTIRPQQLVINHGLPRQTAVLNIKRTLLEKIDYAQAHWGATIFYVDSNDGVWRPDEVVQLRLLAAQRPDILLIPEHHYLPYWAFSAPYVSLRKGNPDMTSKLARELIPASFQVLDVADATPDEVAAAWHPGDILLFRAWFWNSDCQLLANFQPQQP
jgi:hypothetical protein